MKPPSDLAAKDLAIEEPIDRAFFRPIGYRLARALVPTRVTADQVTIASLVVGLVAGHLLFYRDWRLGTAGVLLFVISDLLDSADGQLARLRGTSTRFGRTLDGMSDNLRFVNLYLHLAGRLWVAGMGWAGLVLAVAAGLSHGLQATAVDFVRQVFLRAGGEDEGELDLPEDVGDAPAGLGERLAFWSYRGYVRRQSRMFPRTLLLLRQWRLRGASTAQRNSFQDRALPLVRYAPWIGQNVRFALLAVTAVPGWPAAFCFISAGPLNLLLLAIVFRLERISRRFRIPMPRGRRHAYVA